jgi:hypothetical protein
MLAKLAVSMAKSKVKVAKHVIWRAAGARNASAGELRDMHLGTCSGHRPYEQRIDPPLMRFMVVAVIWPRGV